MWPFHSVSRPSPKRLVDLENELGDATAAIAWLRKAVADLNGRLSTIQRQQKVVEDAPSEPIDEQPDIPAQGNTSHLARRFRGF